MVKSKWQMIPRVTLRCCLSLCKAGAHSLVSTVVGGSVSVYQRQVAAWIEERFSEMCSMRFLPDSAACKARFQIVQLSGPNSLVALVTMLSF